MKRYGSFGKKLISVLSAISIWIAIPAFFSLNNIAAKATVSEGFEDSFNRETLGTDWADSGSVSSMVSGKLKITLSDNPGWSPSTNKNVLVNGVDTATQYVSVDLRGDQLTWSGQQFAGLWTRFKNKSGYCLYVSAGKLVVRKYVNDNNSISSTAFGTDYKWYDYSYNSTHQYRLALSVANNTDGKAVLRATILDDTLKILVFDKTFTDTGEPLTTGSVGLFCEGVNASALFDNFYYSATDPQKDDYGVDWDFSDFFNRTTLGTDWTDSGSVSSIVSNKLKITLSASPGWNPCTNKNLLANGVDTATQYVSVDLQGDQLTWSGQQFAGLWTRFKNKSGYCLYVSGGKLVVRKYVNDNNIGSAAFGADNKWYDFSYSSTRQYRLAMSVTNNADGKAAIHAMVLDYTTKTLVFDKIFTDAGDPLTTGSVGLFCDGSSASASFDNFYYSPKTPREGDFNYTDSFNRTTLGTDWTDSGSVSSMVSNKLKITLPANPGWSPSTNKNVLVNGMDTETQYVSVDLQGDQLTWTGQQFAGLWTRFKSKSGYCLYVSGGKLVVRKYINDNNSISSTAFGSDYKWYDFSYNSTHQYRLAMSVTNNADGKAVIHAMVLDDTTDTLVFDKIFTDTGDPLTTGSVGLFCEGANASALFDNFYYSPISPKEGEYDFTDSFNRTTLGTDWTDSGSVSSMVSNKLKIALSGSPGWSPSTNKNVLVNGMDTETQYVSVDLRGDQLTWSGQQFAGLWTRFKNKSGYCMFVSAGKLVVRKYVNDNNSISSTAFGTDYQWYDFSYNSTHQYRLALSVANNTDGKAVLRATILDYTTNMLVFDKTFIDSSDPLTTGTVGLFCEGANASASFDNFYYSPTDPRKGDYGIDGEFTDSFDREDPGAVWSDSGSVSSIISGKLKITLPVDPGWSPSTNKNVLVNGLDTNTQYVSVDLQGDQLTWSGQQFAGLWTRFKNKSGYCLYVSGGKLVIRKYVNDNNIGSAAFGSDYQWYDYSYNSTHQYHLAMSVSDDADGKAVIHALVLDNNTNTLVFDKTFIDVGDSLTTGTVGLFCEGSNAIASFDNFYYSPTILGVEEMKGGSDKEAQTLLSAILNAGDNLDITGTKYYISNSGDNSNDGLSPDTAWRTPDALDEHGNFLSSGDGVLFERGSIFRQNSSIKLHNGVTYGAYGTGNKPVIYGSCRNYAETKLWVKSAKENVWITKMETSSFVGNIVFNHGEAVGVLKGEFSGLGKNLDYYFSPQDRLLYVYLDTGCPGDVYEDIEVCIRNAIFSGPGNALDITIDNICMKYTGAGAIEFNYGNNTNITITNCEIAWWGGSYLWDGSAKVRGGNGIQLWNNSSYIKVSHDWIYQGYDAGISPQGNPGTVEDHIEISSNLIEYCTWSYEQWVGNSEGQMSNTVITNNIMRFAGYGWGGGQRPDSDYNSHFNAWSYHLTNCLSNYSIVNNIFDISSHALVAWHWETGEPVHLGLSVSGNTFYQQANENHLAMWFGYGANAASQLRTATNQTELEAAVAVFDTSPTLVKWLD